MAITRNLIETYSDEERIESYRNGQEWKPALEHWELAQLLNIPTHTMQRLISQHQRWERTHTRITHTLGELDWLFTKLIVTYLVEIHGTQVLTAKETREREIAAALAETKAYQAQLKAWNAEHERDRETNKTLIEQAKADLKKTLRNQRKDNNGTTSNH